MIATGKRPIQTGHEFDHLFPKARGKWVTIKESANLSDTIRLMKKVVRETLTDTEKIAQRLQVDDPYETCKRIWHFCYNHIQYRRDEEGKEQVRRPSRSWRDRKQGIDCDCFSVLIGSILTHLGIPYLWRMTKYESTEFEHIYPVALTSNKSIIMDCVVSRFNYEVPYNHKKDIHMKLQMLNGTPDKSDYGDLMLMDSDFPIDAIDLFGEELQGLEGKAEREARKNKRKTRREIRTVEKGTFKERTGDFFNKVNKFNPATALLRAGILASMKLNIMQVASKLRFSYWTINQARANQMDLSKYNSLKQIREKLERTFYTAGGRPDQLKLSILSGKGNRNNQVSLNGLGELVSMPDDHDDLRAVLGEGLVFEELEIMGQSIDGLHGLGAVATATAVTAASGFIATIAGLLKKLGNLFKKGSPAEQLLKIQENSENEEEKTRRFSIRNVYKKASEIIQKRKGRKELMEAGIEPPVELDENIGEEFVIDTGENAMTKSMDVDDDAEQSNKEKDDDSGKRGVGDWIKENKLLATGIGIIVATGVGLGIRAIVKNKKKKGLSGLDKTPKRNYNKKSTPKKSKGKKTNSSSPKSTTGKTRTNQKRKKTSPRIKVEYLKD